MLAIPYGRQEIDQADIDSVVEVLRSDYLTQGPVVPRFEDAVAGYCGAKHAVAVNSATSALHVACLALRVGPGDLVWTSPITFVATANCVRYCGGEVDFVDIDPRTCNLSVDCLAEKLRDAEAQGRLPKVVIPVHLAGQSCEMQRIHALGQRYGFRIIEDASHAIGGRYAGERVGGGRHSDITVFSFHPVKIITTGEGGMALTADPGLADRMRLHRSHGVVQPVPSERRRNPGEIWNYEQIALGYNYRMTDIAAALGMSQMRRLDEFVVRRHAIARRYRERLAGLPVEPPWQHPDCHSSFHLYIVRLKPGAARNGQRRVFEAMRKEGVLVNLHYIPVYRQPYYESSGFTAGYCPHAEQYFTEAMSLPMYPGLTDAMQDRVVDVLARCLDA